MGTGGCWAGKSKGMRSFLCSRSARPQKGLARRPQSKAPHTLTWLGIELEKRIRMVVRSGRPIRLPSREEKPSELGRSIGSSNYSVAAEVGDDESRVGDGVCREGGCELTGHRGTQSFARLANGKREGRVLLNLPEMFHRIPSPSREREPRQPRLGGEGHGASSTDSRFPVVAVLPCSLGCCEFLFNQRCWCHQAGSFRWLNPFTVSRYYIVIN
jgi:hypothetical protein